MNYQPAERPKDEATERELQRIAQSLNQIYVGKARVMHVEPIRPADGQIVICDGNDWDPLGDGVKRPVWYDVDAAVWKAFG